MTFQKTPGGTRGTKAIPANAFSRFTMRMMVMVHRMSGDRFMGQDLLYLTTVGAKSGHKRLSTLGRFADGDDSWLVVASVGGAVNNPGWYHNIAAHPDQVWAEIGRKQFRVTPQQLEGEERAEAWGRITTQSPRYAGYATKTDRVIPIIRLTRAEPA